MRLERRLNQTMTIGSFEKIGGAASGVFAALIASYHEVNFPCGS